MKGTSDLSIESEIMSMRVPFLIWKNKQKKEGLMKMGETCHIKSVALKERSRNTRRTPSPGRKEEHLSTNEKFGETGAQALYPCPPNSPIPGQTANHVDDIEYTTEDS